MYTIQEICTSLVRDPKIIFKNDHIVIDFLQLLLYYDENELVYQYCTYGIQNILKQKNIAREDDIYIKTFIKLINFILRDKFNKVFEKVSNINGLLDNVDKVCTDSPLILRRLFKFLRTSMLTVNSDLTDKVVLMILIFRYYIPNVITLHISSKSTINTYKKLYGQLESNNDKKIILKKQELINKITNDTEKGVDYIHRLSHKEHINIIQRVFTVLMNENSIDKSIRDCMEQIDNQFKPEKKKNNTGQRKSIGSVMEIITLDEDKKDMKEDEDNSDINRFEMYRRTSSGSNLNSSKIIQ